VRARRAGIYVRVSTGEQDTAMQETELRDCAERRGWAVKLYRDQGESGARESRPGLNALLDDARRRRIDLVMVWSLDRLARSLRHLLSLAEEFHSLGVDLCSHKQAIDTSSPAGRLTYQVLGA
jgi:DNA invertase Pin-like site-specific DNA recombinase